MPEEESAAINENQDDRAHSLANPIIFYFKDIDSEGDSNVERTENEWLAEEMW